MQQNFMLSGDPLSLSRIRSTLIRLEDTIIFALIERAQFAHNPKIYERGGFGELGELGFVGSWLDWFLKETETFHAKARRYTSPDEYPFTSNLPPPVLPPLSFPKILHPNTININKSILSLYTRAIIPRVTRQATIALAAHKRAQGVLGDGEYEDDGNYGSAATIDVEVLQAISKRVHYGKFVSESKFKSHPEQFIPHIRNPNPAALEALITKPEVEAALLRRVRAKARQYGQDVGTDGRPVSPPAKMNGNGLNGTNGSGSGEDGIGKIDVNFVVELYEDYIIPLTKEVEVAYLLKRLDGLSDEDIEQLMKGNENKS